MIVREDILDHLHGELLVHVDGVLVGEPLCLLLLRIVGKKCMLVLVSILEGKVV